MSGASLAIVGESTSHSTPSASGPAMGRRRHRLCLAALTAVAAALYATFSLLCFHTFRSGTYDLVIFDQAVRSYSRFHLPVAMVKGVHDGFGPGFSVLGDHWSPILALLAPTYWIHDGPVTLLVAQAVLVALAVPPLWAFTRREFGGGRAGTLAAYLVCAGYALCWPVTEATAFDFHEVAFVPVLTSVLFERFSAYRHGTGRWWHGVLPAVALLAVKEDMGLLVAGFGAVLLLRCVPRTAPRRRAHLVLGVIFVLGGLGAAWLSIRVLVPAFGGDPDYYWAYDRFGPDAPSAVAYMLLHPLETLNASVHPAIKVRTLLWLLAVGAATPLASPYVIVPLPLLAARLLNDRFPNWWTPYFQYNAFIVIPILCAAVDGTARLRRLIGRRSAPVGTGIAIGWAGLVLAGALVSLPSFVFSHLADSGYWVRDARMRAAAAADAHVPSGALVETTNYLGPQISARTRVLLWDRTPRWAPWVVADTRVRHFPFHTLDEQRQRVDLLRRSGYQVVFEEEGYAVLHRARPASGGG
ncbi:DUF2079 domain-containing protein [Actinoallomurus sp. NPDC052274]|uniref:DUF2079 domain-containing protein n=1 Tax=Actinoallomurus sp. NPDC052274 TaxID=3155420 RepID=UPI003446C209